MNMRSTQRTCLLLLVALALPACDLEVGNLNNLDLEEFEENPTPTLLAEASAGLLIGNRVGKAGGSGFVSIVGILGRESYNLDPADPRYRTELLEIPELDSGSPVFGGNFWVGPYRNIRNTFLVLAATDNVDALTEVEREAIRGFAKTIQAMEFLTLVLTRWDNGVAIDVNREAYDDLAPLESRDVAFTYVADTLDAAKVHLEAAGSVFPFALGRGFAGFDTPETFLLFNRALRARVAVYRQEWDVALAAVSESFLSLNAGALDVGPYYAYGAGAGDVTNGLNSSKLYVHPSVVQSAELKANGSIDDRVTRKIFEVNPIELDPYTSSHGFAAYQSPTAPLPIIRNEELILIRAEAYIGKGEYDNALPDINFIRTESGGLDPVATLDATTAVTELLNQRFYSLLYEGGHRWIDMRRYDRLEELKTYDEKADLAVHTAFPIPADEQNARDSGG